MAKQIVWVKEETAAEKLGCKPRTLRRYVKSGKLDISYTQGVTGRFFYDEKAVENQLTKKAVII